MEPVEPSDDQFINAVKAAELLRIGYKTMLRWIKAGRIQAIERRYDYDNAEFLIPLEEVERLRAALTMSQRELVTRFLKNELDAQSLASRLMRAEGQLLSLHMELGELRALVSKHIDETPPKSLASAENELSDASVTSHPSKSVIPIDLAPMSDLPPGSIRLTTFFRDHSIATTTGLDHLVKAHIEPLLLDRGARDHSKERWLSPEQQGRMIIFWDSAEKTYEACADCPHYHDSSEVSDLSEDTEPDNSGQEDKERSPGENEPTPQEP